MAEGAVRLGRRVCDIAPKTRICTLLDCKNRRYRGAGRVSCMSVGYLLENFQNIDGNVAIDVTAAAPRDGYTRVRPVVWTRDTGYQWEIGKDHNLYCMWSLKNVWNGRSKSERGTNFVFIRSFSGNGGSTEPLYRSKTAYYEILGVATSATHAQIKTAYYKQSFMYHPDRNAGSDEATLRFSEISEAYTVLGNKALRKKYDRGLLSSSDLIATARPSAKDTQAASSTGRQSDSRRSVADREGGGKVFDFDEFFKAHYSGQLQRERDIRLRKEEMQRKKDKEESLVEQKMDRMMAVGVGLLLLMAVGILGSLKRG